MSVRKVNSVIWGLEAEESGVFYFGYNMGCGKIMPSPLLFFLCFPWLPSHPPPTPFEHVL